MKIKRREFLTHSAAAAAGLLFGNSLKGRDTALAGRHVLSNEKLRVEFDNYGMVLIEDVALGWRLPVKKDRFSLVLNGETIDWTSVLGATIQAEPNKLKYAFTTTYWKIEVVYELRRGWRFVSKQILIGGLRQDKFRVNRAEPLMIDLEAQASELLVQNSWCPRLNPDATDNPDHSLEPTGMKSYAAFLRMPEMRGIFTLLQNPFFDCTQQGTGLSLGYQPDMDWQTAWGSFPCDCACIGPYSLTGRKVPRVPVPEWESSHSTADGQDEAEIAAVAECVRAYLKFHLKKSTKIHFGWYESDYQIDISKKEDRDEYRRIIDATADVGCDHLVFAPQNTGVSNLADDIDLDAWNSEYPLWLSLSQKIRKDEWHVDRDPIPDSIQELLNYAKSRGVKLMAYVLPNLPLAQNKEWLAPNGKLTSFGHRGSQDWFLNYALEFQRKTGIGGFAFDGVYLSVDGLSRYSQWFGWRRVLEGLRGAVPDIVISGGAFYGKYGPWLHLAGSWPWPMFGDEQPESIVNFPDLHFARVESNRMRYINFLYKNYEYYPTEALPGFISHLIPRWEGHAEEEKWTWTMKTGWRERNFDYLGWKFSVIASIGYAGFNHIVAMLPARDLEEFKHFSAADKAWLRNWLAWTDSNLDTLRNSRLILGEPAIGKADGTAAIAGDRGYIFLFNPNGRKVKASFTLDSSIGLNQEGSFVLREMYPFEGRLWGKPDEGIWRTGDRVTVTLDGTSATMLSLAPALFAPSATVLFNAPGSAALADGQLVLTGVRGEAGTETVLNILIPEGGEVRTVNVNGLNVDFKGDGNMINIHVKFQGQPFARSQQVGSFDPNFVGGTFRGEFLIPARIKDQLDQRKKAWPMPWTEDDLRCTWLASERLLLFVQMARPDSKMHCSLKIDGNEVVLQRAYTSIRPTPHCFVGYYADVSALETHKKHSVELTMPTLEPNRFQGLFFDNVETEYTDHIMV